MTTNNFPGGPSFCVAIANSPSVTPAVGSAIKVATGGTAVTAFAASAIVNCGIIQNPSTATESLFVDFVNAPGTTAPGTNGTTFEVTPGTTFLCPPLSTAVQVNAVTTDHAFVAVAY